MGKYLRKYDDGKSFVSDYNGSGYTRPWVSLTEKKYVVTNNYPGLKLYLLGLFETTGSYSPAYVWGGADENGWWVYGASDNEEIQQMDINECSPESNGTGFCVDSQVMMLDHEGYKTKKCLDYNKPVTEITVDLTPGSEDVVVNANPLGRKELECIVNTYPMLVHMTNIQGESDYTFNGLLVIKECYTISNTFTWEVLRDGTPAGIEAQLDMQTNEVHFYVANGN